MAEVVTHPIRLRGGDYIDLRMEGKVVANLSDTLITQPSPLSLFLQNFLHGLDNPILIRGLSSLPSYARSKPPAWLLDSLPSLALPLTFPGSSPPPKIIQSVTIEHMRISESGGKMRASGIVVAQVELPGEMGNIELDVNAVLPDVLVYDGPAPSALMAVAEGEDYPPRAFGRIHPDNYLDATTTRSDQPKRYIVRAPLVNVPLDILPGRDQILSDFVGKVVFKGGAQAGVEGTAGVKVLVKGVAGRVGLDGLPIKGEFWVGRQRVEG
jgi:hypothetical protein